MTPAHLLPLLLIAYQPPVEEEGTTAPAAEESAPEDGAGAEEGAGADGDATSDEPPPQGPEEGEAEEEEEPPPENGAESGASGSQTETAGDAETSPDELDMDDIFGNPDELDLEEVAEEEGGDEDSGEQRRKLLPGDLKTRFRIVTSAYFDIDDYHDGARWDPDTPDRGKISRQENRLEFFFSYAPNEHIEIVGDVEPVFMGVAQTGTLDDLSSRQMLTPFHVESDAAYLAVYDALPGLDVKIGRQTLVWGTADKFNPTNNINPDDLEDRPLFTEPIANQMIVADFAPLKDRLWFQAVYVPIFYPALLPPSASVALQDPEARPPFINQSDVDKIGVAQDLMLRDPRFRPRVFSDVDTPEARIENGQAAGKIGTRLGQLDLSASYYYGFHDIPLPYEATTTRIADFNQDPLPEDGVYFESTAFLRYPRMHVAGLDFAAQIPFLGNLGFWGEAGLFFPTKEHELRIEMPILLDVTPDDDMANPVTEVVGVAVEDRPFLKATGGLDYTFGKHVYVNAQYVRGFINEFGAGNMGNYAVAGTDLIFFGRHLIVRLFGVVEFPDKLSDQYAAALAPDIIVVPPWGYVTLEVGGFALLGGKNTTMAQRGAGSSIVYFKVAGQF